MGNGRLKMTGPPVGGKYNIREGTAKAGGENE
jgi:hypothetical protein